MSSYIFSINQTGSWVNSSSVSFTGTSNVSENTTQITASGGTVVNWKFYANNTLNNWNETDVQSFTVNNAPNVTLSSPPDSSTDNDGNIDFQCNITDDVSIVNVSLYTDTTGVWSLNQTKYPELPNNQEYDSLNEINMTGNVLLMHFNNNSAYGENNSYVYDFSGTGNNGTCSGTGCPSFNASLGKIRDALKFDGSDSLNIPSSQNLNITDVVTMEAWVFPYNMNVGWNQIIMKSGGQYYINYYYKKFSVGFYDINGYTYTLTPKTYDDNKWYHLIGIVDDPNDNIKLYVNGELVVNSTKPQT